MALIATGGATAAASPAANSMAASELMAQARESAAVLESLLQGASLPPPHGGLQLLAAEILRCCDRALAVMRAGEAAVASGVKRKPATATAPANRKRRAIACGGGGAPAEATRVERSRTSEDGYLWRKYGQKEIKNSKRPRLYFRCSYKDDDGCTATRHIQQSEDDPSLYVITYFGEHTCSCKLAAAAVDDDDGSLQQFVINFGSATASSGSPSVFYSSSDSGHDGDVRRETNPPSSQQSSCCSPEEEVGDSGVKMSKEEPVDSCPAASAMSSPAADVSCASPALDQTLLGCLNWDEFGDIDELMNFDEIDLFQI